MHFSDIHMLAPAKINLFLHVTGKRADGYHLLQSLVGFAAMGDRLTFTAAPDFQLSLSGPFAAHLSAGADNLVHQAVSQMMEIYQRSFGGHVLLTKNLPVAAGLGGGSADAAAVLRVLSRLWGVPPDDRALHSLAVSLGADVPVCLTSKPALIGGVGEQVRGVDHLPQMFCVLVNPLQACPTPAVFQRLILDQPLQEITLPQRPDIDDWLEFLRSCGNDLTTAAMHLCPDIASVLQSLSETPDCALSRLSGSGATCFGLYKTERAAQAAATLIKKAQPGWWVMPTLLSAA